MSKLPASPPMNHAETVKSSSSVFHSQSLTWNISLIQYRRAQDYKNYLCKAEEMLPSRTENGGRLLMVIEILDVLSTWYQPYKVTVLTHSCKINLHLHRNTSANLDVAYSAKHWDSWKLSVLKCSTLGPLGWVSPFCFLHMYTWDIKSSLGTVAEIFKRLKINNFFFLSSLTKTQCSLYNGLML